MKISIIGIGRLGGALALAFPKSGHIVENLVARRPGPAEHLSDLISPPPKILSPAEFGQITSDVILISTGDAEIQAVAESLAENLANRPFVFHTSGSLSSSVLMALAEKGFPTASLHPLVSVSDSQIGSERFADAYFCVEGRPDAVAAAEKLVADLGGKSFSIDSGAKALYHASAVTACGHLVALIDVALEMLIKCGVSEEMAKVILLPLIRSTVENLNEQSPAEALTGTFARADSGTFERHLEALIAAGSEDILKIYLQLAERSLDLADTRNIDQPAKSKDIRKRLSLAKKNLKC